MKIGLAQLICQPAAVEANLARIETFATEAAERSVDLLCFPELALSGYLLTATSYNDALLEEVEAATDTLAQRAAEANMHIAIGRPESAAGRLWNAVYLLGPDGSRLVYRKVHMDYKERAVFAAGSRFVVADNGIGLACCYDIAFPEASRFLALAGSRLLLFPMAWEKRRAWVMEATAAARAIENIAYVACINQTGSVGGFDFHGNSVVLDPLGHSVCRVGEDEGLAVADLDLRALDEIRNSPDGMTFPLLADRRPDLYLDFNTVIEKVES
jgi:predicted amidohydrolase